MIKAELKNIKGKKEGEINLPEEIFGMKANTDLIYQVIRAQQLSRRQNSAHTKERGEVRGGGRKPWRQKGTGRARHGSSRSPIWKGGGVTFGPRNERNYKKKINKKAKRKALFMVLSAKNEKGMIFFVSDFKVKESKTKEMVGVIENLSCKGKTLVVLPEMDKKAIFAARNLQEVDTMQAKDINPFDLMCYKNLVIPKPSVEAMKNNFLKEETSSEKKASEKK